MSGELYNAYYERVEDSKSQRVVRNYLKKMRRYNLVVAESDGRLHTYSSSSCLTETLLQFNAEQNQHDLYPLSVPVRAVGRGGYVRITHKQNIISKELTTDTYILDPQPLQHYVYQHASKIIDFDWNHIFSAFDTGRASNTKHSDLGIPDKNEPDGSSWLTKCLSNNESKTGRCTP